MLALSELVDTLRADGIDAKPHRIHHAIAAGYIPRPPLVAGRFAFTPASVAAVKRYFRSPVRPGRKPSVQPKEA
jgi:hypothetical protein